MTAIIGRYLDNIWNDLRLETTVKQEAIKELETHIEDRVDELKKIGLSEEEAANTCIKRCGSARQIAHKFYEAYSQGTWTQTLLASTPHIAFGLIFALNWWQNISWLLIMLVITLSIALYGWSHGKPTWLFPWLGYSLLPVVVVGLFLLYLPRGWSWIAILLYLPFALRIVYVITIQTIRRDWLYSSLMFFQIPIIVGWFIVVGVEGRFPEFSLARLNDFAPWIGTSFLILAATVAAFVRLRQRWLKIIILLISGLFSLTLVVYYASGFLSWFVFLILIITMFGLFLTPALLERKLKQNYYRR